MKAVILEIIKGRAVIMKADGSVTKIRNKNYSVGDEIYMKEGIFSHRRWAPIVAALLIFAMVGTGTWVYADDYELNAVEVDGDEFTIKVNRRGIVTSVEVDGEEIRFENEDIKDFLEELFDRYEIETIALMGDSQEESEKLAEEIREMIEEKIEESEKIAEEARERTQVEKGDSDGYNEEFRARVENMEVKGLSPEDVDEAKDLGITPGKYNIIKNLMGEEDVDDYLVYLTKEYDLDDKAEGYNKELSKKIMEEFSASRGEKNGVKFQEDEKDTPPGQLIKEQKQEEHKPEVESDDENSDIESGELGNQGKSKEVKGNPKGNSGN
jgi:hypothetical protein